jgi:hypothetical protein
MVRRSDSRKGKRGRNGGTVRRLWRNNGLSLVLCALFVGCLAGQSVAGWWVENAERASHSLPSESFTGYLGSGAFLEVTMENWESEFLQMFVYVLFTVFLFQKGSSESKDPDREEPEEPIGERSPAWARAGGWRLTVYQHSLSLALLLLFALSFALHAIGGVAQFNQEQASHGEPAISLWRYLQSSRFWFESLQNWQSEFLSICVMVVVSIFLRERGSPESKAVASPHSRTGH